MPRAPLSVEEAVALVSASRLFDEQWYAALTGRTFADRAAAVRDWVEAAPAGSSPHPLFEPVWLYPGGRWRRGAPDPLSFWLSRPGARQRSPHPNYPQAELGSLEAWLGDHDPAQLLTRPVARAPRADVVVAVPTADLSAALAWLRHLAGGHCGLEPGAVTGVAAHPDPAVRRVLTAAAASWPNAHVESATGSTGSTASTASTGVSVLVDVGVMPPPWPWLPDLLEPLDRPSTTTAGAPTATATQALLLRSDHTVAGPLLVGHPVADAERLDALVLPEATPGVLARRAPTPTAPTPTGQTPPTPDEQIVLAAHARLFGPDDAEALAGHRAGGPWAPLWQAAGWVAPGRPLRIREGHRALRWSIEVSAVAGPWGRRWGDWHFARSLADALERRGQWVAIDHPETRGRASAARDDVRLMIRGLRPGLPLPDAVNLAWVISHPDEVSAGELAGYDAVWAASRPWAAGHGLPVLLQCTDATRFHPGVSGTRAERGTETDHRGEVLFVGNARGVSRPAVEAALAAGVPVSVIGAGWTHSRPGLTWEAEAIANADLPARYARAAVVLADHHADMRAEGFVANRVFDTLAVGARLAVDEVAGLADVLGPEVGAALGVWRTPADLGRLTTAPYAAFPGTDERRVLARRVLAEHSFDARAATLLERAHQLVDSRR